MRNFLPANSVLMVATALALWGCGVSSSSTPPKVTGAGGDATTAADSTHQISDSQEATDVGSGGVCGDGVCDDLESTASCPKDCKAKPGVSGCLESKCSSAMKSCFGDKTCAFFVDCVAKCGDVSCIQSCVQQGGQPTQASKSVLQCGSKAGCFKDDKLTCGNGTCDAGETAASCKADCGGGLCGNGSCEPGEDEKSCPLDCGNKPPKCGNGKCELGESQKSCPQDCGSKPPFCGDGQCTKGETPLNCKQDCKAYSFCGNGKCEPGETAANCKKDCATKPADPIACAQKHCPKEFALCLGQTQCAQLVKCFAGCGTDESCLNKCASSAGDVPPPGFMVLSQCAQKSGCGGEQPQCGDGKCEGPEENAKSCPVDCQQPPFCGNGKCESPMESAKSCPKDCAKPFCGNGKCDPGESSLNCAKDCGGGSDVLKCAQKTCGSAYKKCAGSKSCANALSCLAKCTTSQCMQGCALSAQGDFQTFIALAQCAQKAGCLSGGGGQCGDGKCSDGESPQTCPQDCSPNKCGDGHCTPGETPQNCPKDCKKNQCGDGKCNFPNETSQNCPKDCKNASLTCKNSCGKKAPNCWCDNQCEQMGDCCPDKKLYCGAASQCGNGKCEPGETTQSCAKDCPPKPVCGNGLCEAPFESSKTCPKDCGAPLKPCKTKNDCTSSEICCIKANGNFCVPSGQCF
ncbi:MAG: hypothetical protein KC502_06050 [Myxococcales bacterium]|nr:hypothetical protein [Myxococcales bacterium]